MSDSRPPSALPGSSPRPVRPAVFLLDERGHITAANSGAADMWRGSAEALIGQAFSRLLVFEVTSDDPDWAEAQWEVVHEATLNTDALLMAQPLQGDAIEITLRIEPAPSGGFIATALPPADSSAAATSASAEGATAFQLLATSGAVGFFDLNLKDGQVTYSPAWKKMLGYADAELPNRIETWRELIHEEDSAAAPDQVGKKNTAGQRTFNVEFRMKHRLGHWVWIQCVGVQVFGSEGVLERIIGLHLDITERKEFEENSLASDERLDLLAGAGPLGVFDLDFTAQKFWYSPGLRKLLGYGEEEAPNELGTFAQFLPAAEAANGAENWLLLRSPGQNTFVESLRLRAKDGREIPVMFGAHRALTRKRDLVRVTGFVSALPGEPSAAGGAVPSGGGASDGLWTDALGVLAEGVLITDARGKVLHANATALRLLKLSLEKTQGQAVADIFHLVNRQSGRPGDDPCDRALAADKPLPLISEDALATGEGGAPRPVVWTARASTGADGKPRGVVIVFRDPEEMSLTPEELVRANRFESLGLLAGGIAHDFNNLLTTILGGVSLAKDNHNYSALEDSEKACTTAKGLTRQLLAFAKGGAGTQVPVSPKDILADSVKIAAAGSEAVIEVNVPDDVQPVQVDRAQILQVFQNLIVNALQAMPPHPHRPKLQLRAANAALAEGQIDPLPAGEYVEFEVRDNGSGIAPEHLQKIFDPFFTTKKHGTGLGLATVLSIVRKHGGQIGLDSTVGTGTVFTIFLPRADRPVEVQARRAPSLRFGTGRILFMDDDPKISALTATMLQSLDYKFDMAKNGEEALVLYKRYLNIGRPYDAVILDITVIGGMGGEECFNALRAMDQDVRAIVSSGYDNDDMARRFMDLGFCGYLTKPYRVAELGKVLKTVLG